MDKHYSKVSFNRLLWPFIFCLSVAFSIPSWAAEKVNFAPAYIALSDALGATKAGQQPVAKAHLQQIDAYLTHLALANTANHQLVIDALKTAYNSPSLANLTTLSASLIQLEKYVNPVDYDTLRKQFRQRVMPTYQALADAIAAQDKQALEATFRVFNQAWAKRERVVHETSMGHYGQIETALALLNVAKSRATLSWDEISEQSNRLATTLASFNNGEIIATSNSDMGLSEGVALLNSALSDYQQSNQQAGNNNLMTFIENWPVFEHQVSTRSSSLYTQVESQLPLILAAEGDSKSQRQLAQLINDLSAINPTANYSAIDAALILLREGLEALLIVIALFSAMQAAKQQRGQRWVVAGAALGLLASLLLAWGLVRFLPTHLAGNTREILEGVVGLIAVVMMLFVGLWLHGKSTAQSWQAFLQKHTRSAVTAGSFVSLASLSFLAVFREGAETVLFYAGILPKIALSQFFLGIIIALVILAVVAVVIVKTSVKLPIPVLFKTFTWLIYFLGFKMLGVSLHALQLTGDLSINVLAALPTINFIGFYPTLETLLAHTVYLLLIAASIGWQRRQAYQYA